MYNNIHTIEWDYLKDFSTEKQKYFYNRIDGRFLGEVETKNGREYYQCSDAQVKTGNLGIYLGCIANKPSDRNYGHRMVVNHDRETESTISVNDEVYL